MHIGEILAKIVEAGPAVFKHSTFSLGPNGSHVYLEITKDIRVKTLQQILIHLNLSGYAVFMRARFNRWTMSVAQVLAWHPQVRLIWRSPAAVKPNVLLTDDDTTSQDKDPGAKTIHLSYDFSPRLKLNDQHFAMPFPMHPQIYVQYRDQEKLIAYRQTVRRVRILFAGNWNQSGYDDPVMGELFKKLSRRQIIEYLYRNKLAQWVTTQKEMDDLFSGDYTNGLVIIDSSRLRIDQGKWLSFVSQAEFFLCPPGVLIPPSHNAIEAMAVGTIPLINYPDWFFPDLKHMTNCMIFSSFDDLQENLNAILRMEARQISEMRGRTIDYYDQHLASSPAFRRIIESETRDLHLHVLEENVDLLRQAMTN